VDRPGGPHERRVRAPRAVAQAGCRNPQGIGGVAARRFRFPRHEARATPWQHALFRGGKPDSIVPRVDIRKYEAAHEWVIGKGLTPADFNAVGAINVAVTALMLGHFEFAADWTEKAPQSLLDESPGLQLGMGYTNVR
jgi:hypothetical protein